MEGKEVKKEGRKEVKETEYRTSAGHVLCVHYSDVVYLSFVDTRRVSSWSRKNSAEMLDPFFFSIEHRSNCFVWVRIYESFERCISIKRKIKKTGIAETLKK